MVLYISDGFIYFPVMVGKIPLLFLFYVFIGDERFNSVGTFRINYGQ